MDLSGLWNSGLASYTGKDWEKAMDMIEEAVRLYDQYEKHSLICHKKCEDTGQLVVVVVIVVVVVVSL